MDRNTSLFRIDYNVNDRERLAENLVNAELVFYKRLCLSCSIAELNQHSVEKITECRKAIKKEERIIRSDYYKILLMGLDADLLIGDIKAQCKEEAMIEFLKNNLT